MTTTNDTLPRPATQAVAFAPRPATCQHTDRPAWPVSETGACHACHDLEFRTSMFVIGARAAGFDVAPDAAHAMMVNLNSVALAVPAMAVAL